MSRQDQFDFLFKIVMIGDSGVGKTNLLSRFVDGQFSIDSKPTIGVQFATKTINHDKRVIKNQIWDTAGQERFRAITNAYYRGAVGAIITYDLSKANSFQHVQKWLSELKQYAEKDITIMLLGNKCDLEGRQVRQQMAQDYASNNGLMYLQTSAALGQNVDEAFKQLITNIYEKMKMIPEEKKISNQTLNQTPNQDKKINGNSSSNNHINDSKAKDKIKLDKQTVSANEKDKKKGCC